MPWTKNGFYYDHRKYTPSKHPYYYAGLYYIQEPSAMTPASVLDIEDGDVVLDICAAPGGKSTELAAKLNGTGILISNDISNSRAKALLKNLELFGIGNMCVVSEPPNNLSKAFEGTFDKILIDAPCSGEGMFRKSSSMMTAWENNGTELFAGLQRGILNEACKMLKPGGKLLYSTCTFSPEEDERSVEYLLSIDDSMHLVDFPKYEKFDDGNPAWGETGNPELVKCSRLWPHHVKGEGHFIALFEKDQDDSYRGNSTYSFKSYRPDEDFIAFIKHVSESAGIKTDRIEENKGRLYYISEGMPDVKGLRLLRHGLFLGEVKKNRFEPSQSLAMYLKSDQFDNVVSFSADDIRVIKYLKGETVELEDDQDIENGYVLVCVDGYPLGWAKNNRGVLKNKYLSGWTDDVMRKVAIITGASSGIGREFALQIAQRYRTIDEIWLIARRKDRLAEVKTEINAVSGKLVRILALDLTDETDIKFYRNLLERQDPSIRVLVNAAGYGIAGHFENMTVDDVTGMLDLNCKALAAITHISLSYMAGPSNIINLASSAAFLPQPSFAIYAASKSMVLSFSRALNRELEEKGITVTAVCPGPVKTEFFDVAQKYTKSKPYKMILRADPVKVVKKALFDAYYMSDISVYSPLMKAFRLVSKYLPHSLLIRFMK